MNITKPTNPLFTLLSKETLEQEIASKKFLCTKNEWCGTLVRATLILCATASTCSVVALSVLFFAGFLFPIPLITTPILAGAFLISGLGFALLTSYCPPQKFFILAEKEKFEFSVLEKIKNLSPYNGGEKKPLLYEIEQHYQCWVEQLNALHQRLQQEETDSPSQWEERWDLREKVYYPAMLVAAFAQHVIKCPTEPQSVRCIDDLEQIGSISFKGVLERYSERSTHGFSPYMQLSNGEIICIEHFQPTPTEQDIEKRIKEIYLLFQEKTDNNTID